MKYCIRIFYCIILFSTICCCKRFQKNNIESTTTTTIEKPIFNSDSAYYFIQQQLAFGPRVPNSLAQKQCASYLANQLQKYGCTVVIQNTNVTVYNGKSVPCFNVIGSINPTVKRRLLLCTHWDSRPFADQDSINQNKPIMAADDGASGTAVLIEIARQLQIKNPGIGIDLVFFDVEDYGSPENDPKDYGQNTYCLGTQYWCKNPHIANYKAENGILLDMVGAKNATFYYEGVSMQYASAFNKQIWETAHQLGYANYFIKQEKEPIIDDHYYINEMTTIPTIDIINRGTETQSGFAKHWHTHQDNMEIIDKKILQAVGEVVLSTCYTF